MGSKSWGIIKCPIHGYITISQLEKEVIDTRVFQRLRRIRQLAGSEYVYPGANHTRFEHALGVMHLAGVLAGRITSRAKDIQVLRLAGLLHDVGHGPFSHTFEHLLARQGRNHEDLTTWLIQETELADILKDGGVNPKEMGLQAIGKRRKKNRPYFDQTIRSSIDVDKMDYIVRDSFHTGAEYGNVDIFRLIYTIEVFKGDLAVNVTALAALEAFLLARILSFKSVYFHRSSRAVQIMLADALELADDELAFSSFKTPDEYLELDDYSTWTRLKQCSASRPLMERLERRDFLSCVYSVEAIVQESPSLDLFTKDAVRKQFEAEIAAKAKVAPETVRIDSPLLPSLPYRHSSQLDPMEIPGFAIVRGRKIPVQIAEVSRVIRSMKGYLDIVRVYTSSRPDKERVGKAAQEVLGGATYSAGISM
jgi:HD superfamily phosphohydrolase